MSSLKCEFVQNEEIIKERKEKIFSGDDLRNICRLSRFPVSVNSLRYGIFVEVNDNLLKHLEYCKDEMLGKTAYELNIFPKKEEYLDIIRALINDGSIRDYRFKYRTKTGEERAGVISADLVKGENDSFVVSSVMEIVPSKYLKN